jgi:hypothetical protein
MLNIKLIPGKYSNFLRLLIILNLVLNLAFVSLIDPVSADEGTKKSTSTNSNNSNYGLPTHRRDGGSRNGGDNCLANGSNLVALIPDKTVGINSSPSPKLFFYVPEVSQQKTIEFVLRNDQDELMYEAFLTTEGRGIMSIEVPAKANSHQLKADHNYHWYLSMICDPQQRSRDVVVEGWMHQAKVDLTAEQELNSADSLAKADLYRQQGFWYDALSLLAKKQSSQDSEVEDKPIIEAKWLELLESVGLEKFASEPFVESEIIKTSLGSRRNF